MILNEDDGMEDIFGDMDGNSDNSDEEEEGPRKKKIDEAEEEKGEPNDGMSLIDDSNPMFSQFFCIDQLVVARKKMLVSPTSDAQVLN